MTKMGTRILEIRLEYGKRIRRLTAQLRNWASVKLRRERKRRGKMMTLKNMRARMARIIKLGRKADLRRMNDAGRRGAQAMAAVMKEVNKAARSLDRVSRIPGITRVPKYNTWMALLDGFLGAMGSLVQFQRDEKGEQEKRLVEVLIMTLVKMRKQEIIPELTEVREGMEDCVKILFDLKKNQRKMLAGIKLQ